MLAHTVKHLPSFISIYFHDFPFLPVLPFPFSCVPARPNHIPLCSALPCCAVLWCDVVRSALPCLDLLCSALPCLALLCLAQLCLVLPCLVPHLFGAVSSSTLLSYPYLSSPTLCYAIVLYRYPIFSLLSVILKHQKALSATQASTRTQYGHCSH